MWIYLCSCLFQSTNYISIIWKNFLKLRSQFQKIAINFWKIIFVLEMGMGEKNACYCIKYLLNEFSRKKFTKCCFATWSWIWLISLKSGLLPKKSEAFAYRYEKGIADTKDNIMVIHCKMLKSIPHKKLRFSKTLLYFLQTLKFCSIWESHRK